MLSMSNDAPSPLPGTVDLAYDSSVNEGLLVIEDGVQHSFPSVQPEAWSPQLVWPGTAFEDYPDSDSDVDGEDLNVPADVSSLITTSRDL